MQRFFRKAQAAREEQARRAAEKELRKRLKLTGTVLVTTRDGRKVIMSAAEARKQLARSKGGRTIHKQGKAHQFNSESGRAARAKQLSKRSKFGYLIQRSKNRTFVRREHVRAKHANKPELGVWYWPESKVWMRREVDPVSLVYVDAPVSERQALRLLGYLKTPGIVPVTISPIGYQRGDKRSDAGTVDANYRDRRK